MYAGANIGPRVFVLGFTTNGIFVTAGHEVMIHEAWLGEYIYSNPLSHLSNLTAVGISVVGNDHYINNVIVFSSKIGISVAGSDYAGAANLLTGTHTWSYSNDVRINN